MLHRFLFAVCLLFAVAVPAAAHPVPFSYLDIAFRNGQIEGMISVNATSGAVWPHWWHGQFVEAG